MIRKSSKNTILGLSIPQKSSFGEAVGASLGSLGASWAVLASLGCVKKRKTFYPGALGSALEGFGGVLKPT